MSNLSEATERIIRAEEDLARNSEKDELGFSKYEKDKFERQHELAADLAEKQGIPLISAIVIAGDLLSKERSERWVEQGADAVEVARFVGSYGRFDFIVEQWQAGRISDDWFFENLVEEWRGADPDDTNPLYLHIWEQARERWGGGPKGKRSSYIRDGKPLPKGPLIVYRGQLADPNETLGIAWSLNKDIAMKFAKTGGLRGAQLGGNLLKLRVPKDRVLAYITGRGEDEVIFDPRWAGFGQRWFKDGEE